MPVATCWRGWNWCCGRRAAQRSNVRDRGRRPRSASRDRWQSRGVRGSVEWAVVTLTPNAMRGTMTWRVEVHRRAGAKKMGAFLLWNVRRKPLDSLVQNLVRQHNIDVVLLVEYAFGVSQLPFLLLNDGLVKRISSPKFGVFVRNTHGLRLFRYRLGKRANLWSWVPPSGRAGTVALLHGFDRRNYDDSTRRAFFRRVAEAVQRREGKAQHQRTIIAGDFNADPFDSAIAAVDGLHALGVRAIKMQASRAVSGAAGPMDFFYNPMWRAYGQQPSSEAGAATHHWLGRWAHELGWHMLDQVVLRPGESSRFPEDQIRILTEVGGISLVTAEGVPDSQTASDHLPVVFHWNL